jgi:hypothetical protein
MTTQSKLTDIQRKWLINIRDLPTDKIGKGRLFQPDTGAMCVLGVLCELYREKHPDKSWWTEEGKFYIRCYNPRTSKTGADMSYVSKELYTYMPPDDVLNWAGVPVFINTGDKLQTIASLQDKGDIDNPTIARIIANALSISNQTSATL